MKETPFNRALVETIIDEFQLPDFSKVTIREMVGIANEIEKRTGKKMARMEMGVPGLPASQIGVQAEIEALQSGVASIYPPLEGVATFKEQASRFVKAFIGVDVPSNCCTPVVGSMQGTIACFMTARQLSDEKTTVLFIDPGFPVQKQQLVMLDTPYESFDAFHFRGEALREELERHLSKGHISALIYSNPNNPAWFCLQESELQIIGELATKYDVIVLEDLAYFAMDFRKDLSKPFQTPYQASVSRYTDNYVLLISGSKAFSYAGQRIGFLAVSEKLNLRTYPGLAKRYGNGTFGHALVARMLYGLSAGTSHSAQYAMAALMKSACDGEFNFLDDVAIYGRRAHLAKKCFIDNGFNIVYDNDLGEEIADGFYFTVAYPGFKGGDLMRELLFYGISAIALDSTGSDEEGLRICTSFIHEEYFAEMRKNLEIFKENH
ncbi:MAG TPA: pyridoxal phosphate-dependent aminotransferase [Bacteroidales bacterium]|nr:pyridoxal phosphate-dependent aminotransferase [Bacteroidales bacterium]